MSRHATPTSPALLAGRIALALLVSLPGAASIMQAQDAIRPSLAGETAAEARRQSIDRIPYNLQLGPIKFRFSATVGVEYNDNINLAEDASFVLLTRPSAPYVPTSRRVGRPQRFTATAG